MPGLATEVATEIERCANCGDDLHGEFCARCGQRNRDLHQPVSHLLAQAADDFFSLDARFPRTIGLLLVKPGEVTRIYREGKRASFVPPLRAYLIAALAFFTVFTMVRDPEPLKALVVTTDSPEAAAMYADKAAGKLRNVVTVEVPARSPFFDKAYQASVGRAKAHPSEFVIATFSNVPRTFFVLLPLFALLLELFYRTQGYYLEHLVFSLYYHAFVFSLLALRFGFGNLDDGLPAFIRVPISFAMWGWLLVYLPLALRRVYGGSWPKTVLKVVGLGVLYFPLMLFSMVVMLFVALARF